MTGRRPRPRPVWVILRCTGKKCGKTWRHDDTQPFGRPRHCIHMCGAPYHPHAEPEDPKS